MSKLLFSDAHTHTNPVRGLGVSGIVPRFKRVNGWFMALISLAPWHYGLSPTLEHYINSARIVVKECKKAREMGLKCKCFAGVHPADIDKLTDRYNLKLEDAYKLLDKVLDSLIKMCRDGLLDGIGEVGRQHYRTLPERIAVSEILLIKTLEASRDYDFIVHLHMESGGIVTLNYLREICRLIGFKNRWRIIVHHVTNLNIIREIVDMGFSVTIPGVQTILAKLDNSIPPAFMIESDYLDDPKRPGVVVYPWTMVEYELKLLEKGLVDSRYLEKVNIDNIVKVYGEKP